MIEVQERDRRIMKCCYEHQVLSSRIVARYFYPGRHRSEPYRRIQELEKAGYIARRRSVFAGGALIMLTRQGEALVQSSEGVSFPYERRLELGRAPGRLMAASVRLRLQELWNCAWIPPQAFKGQGLRRIPDGFVQFQSGRQIVIHLQAARTGVNALTWDFEEWLHGQSAIILIVAIKPDHFEWLAGKITQEAHLRDRIALVSWSELETGIPAAWTHTGSVEIFSAREW